MIAFEASGFSLRWQIGRGAAMTDNTGMNTETPAEQRGSRGQTRCIRTVAVCEPDPGRGDGVDIGRGIPRITVAAQVIGPHTVQIKIEDTHAGVLFAC